MDKTHLRQRSTMAEFRWIQISFCLMLMFPSAEFCYAVPTTEVSVLASAGEDVTMPCLNKRDFPENCNGIAWMASGRRVVMITLEQTGENDQNYSDRLSITGNCSLVVKKVTAEDVGHYDCLQYTSREQEVDHQTVVDLNVVTMNEVKGTRMNKLICSVVTYVWGCHYTVRWLLDGNVTVRRMWRHSECSAVVSFLGSPGNNPLKCEVTDTHTGKVKLFTFSPQPSETATTKSTRTTESNTEPGLASTADASDEKTGETTTTKSTGATESTTESVPVSTADVSDETTGDTKTTTEKPTKNTDSSTKPVGATSNPLTGTDFRDSRMFVIVSVVSAAVLIAVVIVAIWIRTKGNQRQISYVIHNDEDEDDAAMNNESTGDADYSIRLY